MNAILLFVALTGCVRSPHPQLWAACFAKRATISSREFAIIGLRRPVMYDSLDSPGGQPGLCHLHPCVLIHPCDMRVFLMRWVKNSGFRRIKSALYQSRVQDPG